MRNNLFKFFQKAGIKVWNKEMETSGLEENNKHLFISEDLKWYVIIIIIIIGNNIKVLIITLPVLVVVAVIHFNFYSILLSVTFLRAQ
jgi:hypothetical protein